MDRSAYGQMPSSPFHTGKVDVQRRVGVAAVADQRGRRSIRDHMHDQHRDFFAQLPFMVLAGVDHCGQPWPSLRVGAAGFVSSPDDRTLCIAGAELAGDPLHGAWHPGVLAGGLGIELPTRRRNRVNGVITSSDCHVLTLSVTQSFGNCPQYIQSRTPVFVKPDGPMQSARQADELADDDRVLLERADTFFIATAAMGENLDGTRGVDVSHRGGMPGFVRVDDANTLTVPDSGNNFFNTIGNLRLEPRAGLLFIDFELGDLLYRVGGPALHSGAGRGHMGLPGSGGFSGCQAASTVSCPRSAADREGSAFSVVACPIFPEVSDGPVTGHVARSGYIDGCQICRSW